MLIIMVMYVYDNVYSLIYPFMLCVFVQLAKSAIEQYYFLNPYQLEMAVLTL